MKPVTLEIKNLRVPVIVFTMGAFAGQVIGSGGDMAKLQLDMPSGAFVAVTSSTDTGGVVIYNTITDAEYPVPMPQAPSLTRKT